MLVNDVLDRAVEELTAIVIAERGEASGNPGDAELERSRSLARQCLLENSAERLRSVLASFGISM